MSPYHLQAAALLAISSAVANAQSVGHCIAKETTYFSCVVAKSAKVVSLCGSGLQEVTAGASKVEPWLQYRFGKPGRVELAYPVERTGSLSKFSFESSQSNGAYNYSASFKSEEATYAIEWMAGSETPESQFFGVSVASGGGFQQLPCRGTPQHEFASWSGNFSSLVVGHEEVRPAR